MYAVFAPEYPGGWGSSNRCPFISVPIGEDGETVTLRDYVAKHRGANQPNCGDGNFYSFRCKPIVDVRDCYNGVPYPVAGTFNGLQKGITYISDTLHYFPAWEDAAIHQGYKIQGGFSVRVSAITGDWYITVASYYNPYSWPGSIMMRCYRAPRYVTAMKVEGYSDPDQYWLGNIPYPYGVQADIGAKDLDMSNIRYLLEEEDPAVVYQMLHDSYGSRSPKWCVGIGEVSISYERYLSPSSLSEAVYSGYIPSEYTKAVSDAYFSAMEEIPYSQINPLTVLSDVKALAKTKVALLADRLDSLKSVAQAGSSDYLQYRYGIKTTQMDLQSIKGTIDRFRALWDVPLKVEGYSTAHDGATIKVECAWSLASTRDMLHFSRVGSRIMQRGLVDLWDIVPFSFVVDWFVDVEKYLTDISSLVVNMTWEPTDVWVTIHKDIGPCHEFARIRGDSSLASTLIGLQDYKSVPGNRTIGYHLADSCALITQMFG